MVEASYLDLIKRLLATPTEELGELIFTHWTKIPHETREQLFGLVARPEQKAWAEFWLQSELNRGDES